MRQKIVLNFHVYPLVVGQKQKYTFEDWQEAGGSILLKAELTDTAAENDSESAVINGESEKLYTQEDVRWTSANPDIAVVEKGLVRAVRTGTTEIRAFLPDGSSDTCRIQVIDNIGRTTARYLKLNTDRLVLKQWEGAVLSPLIYPVDYYQNGRLDQTVIWTSQDESVARVDHRGRIQAVGEGETTITARTADVGREAFCHICVTPEREEGVYKEPLTEYDGEPAVMKAGTSQKLLLPQEHADQPVQWCTENPEIADVTEDGVVNAYRAGEVKIWATFINGGWRTGYQIQIQPAKEPEVTELHINKSSLNLATGEQDRLYGIVFPATILKRRLTWQISDENVLQIKKHHLNLSGLDEIVIEAAGAGKACVTAQDGAHTVTCCVTVVEKREEICQIRLPETLVLEPEEIRKMETRGVEQSGEGLAYFSENIKIATVNEDGIVRGIGLGETNVYCCKKADADMLKDILLHKAETAADKLPVYGKCHVTVRTESICLYNLHIPEETVTAESVCLMWNRHSLLDTDHFSYYEIYDNGEKCAVTTKLSCRVNGLAPESSHTFTVAAFTDDNHLICRQSVKVTTLKAASAVLDVTKAPYHAVGNGIASDTESIQRAIDDCPVNGTVLLPEGYVFCSGALFLKSRMTFRVDGILLGSEDPTQYPPVVCRWEGFRKLELSEEYQKEPYNIFKENGYSYSSLINVGVYDEGEPGKLSPYHTFDVHICGKGMINGNGFSLSYNEGPCNYPIKRGNPHPVSPKKDQNVRGRLIAFYNVDRAYISDVTVGYGAAWTLHPVFSRHVTFDNVKVISMGDGLVGVAEGMLVLNGDGIDPDSSTFVNIVDCYFTVGDDAVAVKSGRNRQGMALAKPSAYIRVTDCVCVDAKGAFAIGSESSGTVHDVLFQNLYTRNIKNFGLWIKSAPPRGGLVEHVVMKDCLLEETGGALQIEYRHGGSEDAAPTLPVTRDVHYENITFKGEHKFCMRFMGHPESPLKDISMRGCYFEEFSTKRKPDFVISDCKELTLEDAALPDGFAWEVSDAEDIVL